MKGLGGQGDTHSAAQHSPWFPKFPALTGDTRALVGFTVTEKESFMFSIPQYSRVATLQPDELNREIQRRREKLTQDGDILTCYVKSEKKKKNVQKGM